MLSKFELSADDQKFAKALAYLDENKSSFGIEIDYMMIRVQAQLAYKHKRENNEGWDWTSWFKGIMQDILSVVEKNFKNVGEF